MCLMIISQTLRLSSALMYFGGKSVMNNISSWNLKSINFQLIHVSREAWKKKPPISRAEPWEDSCKYCKTQTWLLVLVTLLCCGGKKPSIYRACPIFERLRWDCTKDDCKHPPWRTELWNPFCVQTLRRRGRDSRIWHQRRKWWCFIYSVIFVVSRDFFSANLNRFKRPKPMIDTTEDMRQTQRADMVFRQCFTVNVSLLFAL